MTTTLYEGTKRVHAKPMNRGDYNVYRGWEVPADENPSDEGYLVEYVDGGRGNDSRHAGYISWSPKDVFERSYKEVKTVPGLAPHQQRVVDEHAPVNDTILGTRVRGTGHTTGFVLLDLCGCWQQYEFECPPEVFVKYPALALGPHHVQLDLPPGRYLVLI